jgi:3-oxoacyl-[acyl-carrier-protein] synthase-3
MALAAARSAIEAAGVANDDIDLIIVATTTPDKVFPSTACIVQRRLGISKIPAFDVHAACSGFIYALDIADRFIRTGGASCALLIGSETYSRILDWSDRATCVLFGDGAGAVVLRAADEPGVISTHIHADGQHEDLLHVPAGISSGYDQVRQESAYIHMKGHEVFRKAVGALGTIARETLAGNDVDKHDIAWLIPHQANLRIIAAAAKKLDLPMERVVVMTNTQTLRAPRFPWHWMLPSGTVASNAVSCCCSKHSARGSPGVPHSSGINSGPVKSFPVRLLFNGQIQLSACFSNTYFARSASC